MSLRCYFSTLLGSNVTQVHMTGESGAGRRGMEHDPEAFVTTDLFRCQPSGRPAQIMLCDSHFYCFDWTLNIEGFEVSFFLTRRSLNYFFNLFRSYFLHIYDIIISPNLHLIVLHAGKVKRAHSCWFGNLCNWECGIKVNSAFNLIKQKTFLYCELTMGRYRL